MAAVESRIGVVAIGRNEGERLVRCLRSALQQAEAVVYVDSGSSDGSVASAQELGVSVLELDSSTPFTAARARNEGFELLTRSWPRIDFVQFLDGDCELQPGWLDAAEAYLREHPEVAMVCGHLRERHPEASPYNRLADMEWKRGVGDVPFCGGNAAVVACAFKEYGAFDAAIVAGEEPELCLRFRQGGLRIVSLDREMALHDSAMFSFRQWWRRAVRAGHACAEVAYLHGRGSERYRVREVASIVAWGGALPLLSLALAPPTLGASSALLSAYAVLWSRVYRHRRAQDDPHGDAALYATATTLGKLAEMEGVARFVWRRLVTRRRSTIIEHRNLGRPPP